MGLIVPIAFASQVTWTKVEIYGVWKIVAFMVLATPFLTAASRRLHDTDHAGTEALYPFMPFIILWIGYQMILWGGYLLAHASIIFTTMLWLIALIILVPLHIVVLFASILATANVVGQMLVPSDTGPNKYGPNPDEKTF